MDRISVTRSSVASLSNPASAAMNTADKLAKHQDLDSKYVDHKTPKKAGEKTDIEGGALVAGGPPDLYSRKSIGLLVNYASVGLVYGTFPQTVYPFLSYYLNMESFQCKAASVLVAFPWSMKVFIGIMSDSFPIFGYKRRPYMVLGWSFCLAVLLLLFFLPVPDAFFIYGNATSHLGGDLKIWQNPLAKAAGGKYISLMALAALGYLIADVAADGMVVEYAMREPEESRGTTQATIYMVRTIFFIFANLLVGVLFNGKDYGGEFGFSVPFNWLMLIVAVGAFWSIPASIFFLEEKKVQRESFVKRCKEMFVIAKRRAVWQTMAFMFLNSLMFDMSASSTIDVQKKWAKAEPINDTISSVLGNLIFAVAIYLTKRYFLQYNWRFTILWTTIAVCLIDVVVVTLTVFDIFRSQWMWLGVPIMEMLPYGIRFLIGTLVTVEIADEGYEAATYGLITTVSNLATPFASTITNQIGTAFKVTSADIGRDTSEVRWDVFYTFLIMYAFKLLSNFTLFLLPKQKKEAQELRKNGGSNTPMAIICFSIAAFALVWSMTINFLSIFESTACLKVAGGSGCP